MLFQKLLFSLLFLSLASCQAVRTSSEWKPAGDHIKTRFAADVDPNNPHPEYPRPQMAREDWMSLNGLWDYAITTNTSAAPGAWNGKILVPFPIESSLSGVGARLDENSLLWYRRKVTIPNGWAGRRIMLHFGAVDWEAKVTINGKPVGSHKGGYDNFSFDITKELAGRGEAEIVVSVFDPTEADQPRGKQSRKPEGIFYTPASGIWRSVWLEPVPETSISNIKILPNLKNGTLTVEAFGKDGASIQNLEARAEATAGGRSIAGATGDSAHPLTLFIKTPRAWTPDDPFLYDLNISIARNGKIVDSVKSYFGMRDSAIGKDEKGEMRMLLNGKFVPQIGTLDQGFWPDGIYTAPTDAALRYDIEMLKKLGFNMTRKHVKVEPDRWYYWCDKLGLLVWQDMPSGNNTTPESKRQYESEMREMIGELYNHPSIVLWVVFNEGWGQYDTPRVASFAKNLDPSRIVSNASGWTDYKCGDVMDIHNYPPPAAPAREASRAIVLGEFGGLGLPVDGHTWTKQHWGYQGMEDSKRLTRQYARFLQKTWELIQKNGLSAAVYTQTTDVETECNGLLTYDRAILKVDLETTAAANQGILKSPKLTTLAADARTDKVAWLYTTSKPAGEWYKPEYDTKGWNAGAAGFGTVITPGAIVKTEWKSSDIWIRREFMLNSIPSGNITLQMHHDEDAEVYINGILAAKAGGYTVDYEIHDISEAARASLREGKNVIAVHCKQTNGGQYLDVGLAVEEK